MREITSLRDTQFPRTVVFDIYSRDISGRQEKFLFGVFFCWLVTKEFEERKSYPLSRTIPRVKVTDNISARSCLNPLRVPEQGKCIHTERVPYLWFTYIIGTPVYVSLQACISWRVCVCVTDAVGVTRSTVNTRENRRRFARGDRVRSRDRWHLPRGCRVYSIVRVYVVTYMYILWIYTPRGICVARVRMTSRGSRTERFYAAAVLSETFRAQ